MVYGPRGYFPETEKGTSTRLLNKHYSPLIVRKYQFKGWPLYIALICDMNIDELDDIVNGEAEKYLEVNPEISLQTPRNLCGYLCDFIVNFYNKKKRGSVEGVAVLAYWDKSFISSLYGDFMNHYSCRLELYQIINTLPHI